MIDFTCPKCGAEMSSPDSLVGESETCPSCGNVTLVPEPDKDESVDASLLLPPLLPPLREPSGRLHKQRIALVCIAGLGMLATFLPWAKIDSLVADGRAFRVLTYVSRGLFDFGDGWITFGLFGSSLGLALGVGKRNQPLDSTNRFWVAVPSILAAGYGLWNIVYVTSRTSEFRVVQTVQVGLGLYLLVLAGIAFVVVCLKFQSLREQIRRLWG